MYARPSALEGAGRLVDFFGILNTYNLSRTPNAADFRAILSDWEAVGLDLLEAIGQAGQEQESGKWAAMEKVQDR